jgi:hypothetical protein
MSGVIYICAQCDGTIHENIVHSCVRGLTENLNRFRHDMIVLLKEIKDGSKNRKPRKATVKAAKKNAEVSPKTKKKRKTPRSVSGAK